MLGVGVVLWALHSHVVFCWLRDTLLHDLWARILQSVIMQCTGLLRVHFPQTSQIGPGFNSTSPDFIRDSGSNTRSSLASME